MANKAQGKSMQTQVEEYRLKLEKFLYQKNGFTDVLQTIEEKTHVKRTYMVLGLLGLTAVWLVFGYAADFLCNIIGFVYPAFKSVKAIESIAKDDDTQWLIYWVVYAFFMLLEFFGDIFLSWFPMYYLIKCGFLIWCMAPITYNGAYVIYNRVIKPFVLKHETKIDKAMHDLTNTGLSAVKEAKHAYTDAAADIVSDQLRQRVGGIGEGDENN